jgi:L-iditol 2-dehydrogenase
MMNKVTVAETITTLGGASVGVVQQGREDVVVQSYRIPPLAAEDVLLEVSVAGICGTDLHQYRGSSTTHNFPDGHEYAGVVVALGKEVRSLCLGQRVVVDPFLSSACGACENCLAGLAFHCRNRTHLIGVGGFGQYVVARAKGCFPLPDAVDDTLGALVEPLAVATHAIRMLKNIQGKSGVVIGAGTVGLCALAAALAAGAKEVYVVAKYPAQRDIALKMGASGVISANSIINNESFEEQCRKDFDFAIEAVGGTAKTLDIAAEFLKPQGEIVVLGAFEPGFSGAETYKYLVKEITIRHSNCYGVQDGKHDFDVAIAHLARSGDALKYMVSHEFSLECAAEAFQMANNKQRGVFKVQIRMPTERTLIECFETIDFSCDESTSNSWQGSGLSHSESWGRWSDGEVVTLRFDRPLPSQMTLMLRARAFGPNADKEFLIVLGNQHKKFKLYEDRDTDIWLDYDGIFNEREMQIFVPVPVSPLSIGMGPDARMIGIGLVEVVVFGRKWMT